MYKRKKKSNHQDDINKFKKVKQLVQRKMRQAYWNYIEEVISIEHVPEQTTGQTRTISGLILNTERKIIQLYQDVKSKVVSSLIPNRRQIFSTYSSNQSSQTNRRSVNRNSEKNKL